MNLEELLRQNGLTQEELDVSDSGIYILDESRTILYWNPAAEALTGYSMEEMLTETCYSTKLKHENEKGMALCTGMCPIMACMFDGEARKEKISLCRKDGSRVWANISIRSLVDHGDVCAAMETFRLEEEQ